MPWTGVDALEAATHILPGLYAWRKTLAERRSAIEGIGSPQLTVGLIKGGINTNVVPGPRHLPARPAHGAGGVLRGGRGRAAPR